MQNTYPAGFITRPQAAKKFNRSQRTLERDVKDAYLANDDEVLSHYLVVTKNGTQIPALETSIEQVAELVHEGKSPVWLVEESYLEREYGLKGSPKPEKQPVSPAASSGSEKKGQPEVALQGSQTPVLPDDVEFLKERIRVLEQEKREEAERTAEREEKLFAQLEVKDKQISAWDEVTQGITKGLATGQLMFAPPQEGNSQSGSAEDEKVVVTVSDAEVVTSTKVTNPPRVNSSAGKMSGTSRKKSSAKNGATTRKRRAKWNEFPTLKRFLSR